jgi:hypothetical protein
MLAYASPRRQSAIASAHPGSQARLIDPQAGR